MGLFGQSTPFDVDIEKATSETNTNENWGLILDVCDKVTSNPRTAKDCLKTIMKRMGHADPHVVMQAITLLDACANNCGKPFHLEVASREFENEFKRLLVKAQPKVSLKMRQVLKNWAENDFKADSQLNLIPSLYNKLRLEGYDFSHLNEKPGKSASKMVAAVATRDPNVVSNQQEEDDIAKAIELSLKETKGSPKHQSAGGAVTTATSATGTYTSLYPSFSTAGSIGSLNSAGGAPTSTQQQPEARKVRALYDFEAAEENELTFYAGEFIHVLDDSDPNWWKGYNQRGDGLFPSNFVTADLSVEPEHVDINKQQAKEASNDMQQKSEAASAVAAQHRVEVDEAKIDRLLHLLHEANPEDPSQDSEEMLRLEQEVHQMGPLIDAELERVDRKHAQLTQLSSDLVDAINLYHSLMRDDRASAFAAMPSMSYQTAPTPLHTLYGAASYAPSAIPTIPMGMQNGHIHSAQQLNGSYNGMPNLLLQQQSALPQQQPLYGAGSQEQAAVIQAPQPLQANYQMLSTQQQQLQQQHQHPPPSLQQQPPYTSQSTTQHLPHGNSSTPSHQQQHQPQQQQNAPHQSHFMSPQHQQPQAYLPAPPQQQQPQYVATAAPPSNGGIQQGYVPPGAMMPPSMVNNNPNVASGTNNNNIDQYNQLQQQMAAMSMMGGGMGAMALAGGLPAGMNHHQPVTQSFLVQNEPKNNIPIYQQQR